MSTNFNINNNNSYLKTGFPQNSISSEGSFTDDVEDLSHSQSMDGFRYMSTPELKTESVFQNTKLEEEDSENDRDVEVKEFPTLNELKTEIVFRSKDEVEEDEVEIEGSKYLKTKQDLIFRNDNNEIEENRDELEIEDSKYLKTANSEKRHIDINNNNQFEEEIELDDKTHLKTSTNEEKGLAIVKKEGTHYHITAREILLEKTDESSGSEENKNELKSEHLISPEPKQPTKEVKKSKISKLQSELSVVKNEIETKGISKKEAKLVCEIKEAIQNEYPDVKLDDEALEKEIKIMVVFNRLFPKSNMKLYSNGDDLPLTFRKMGKDHFIVHLKEKNGEKKLGIGGFKIVYKALEINLNKKKAKLITHQKSIDKSSKDVDKMEEEVKVQSKLKHKNIMPVIGHAKENGSFAFYSKLSESDLEKHIKVVKTQSMMGKIPEDKVFNQNKEIVVDIARGLKHMHKKNMCHNDIKADNILRDNDHWRLNDFGLSKKDGEAVTHVFAKHIAPEQLDRYEMGVPAIGTKATDTFEFGILVYEIFFGKFPRDKDGRPDLGGDIFKKVPQNDKRSIKLKAIILDCIDEDPSKRPSISKVKERLKAL